ncbi:NAD-dependent epimerase/dehydratase family protein [Chamaesiphon sp. VAR_69_metabat_338]|uniref:NAD-dependent epimerase/dehydratase family protein n=1 Tax=Chamaesiphon sp. VAR_69_metabat_338 TaxID=2964704 RepID=UPI00286E25BE|nr:NAD-dependent epimerase/dehydratase family protein [Chamaesiphon sp. VAR_69_metabat_338]
MSKIAIFGATGAIGQSIAAALRVVGQPYRVVGRSHRSLQAQFGSDPLAEIVTWHPEDPDSVIAAARNIETIVYTVGVPYVDFHLHPLLMRQTLAGAIAAGVKQMLLIGTIYPCGRPQTERIRENHPRQPHTFKGKMRKEQEDILLAADATGSIRGAIVRLPDFYGPNVELSFLHSAFQAVINGKQAQLIGPIDTPHEFMFVPDVGPVVLAMVNEPRTFGRIWHFGGAGTITQREFVGRIFARAGQKPRLMVANKLMLQALGLIDPFMRELVEMHYLWTTPAILDDTALHQLLGTIHKTDYDRGIELTLDASRLLAIATR